MLLAQGSLDSLPQYFSWGWLSVSMPNLIMIIIMVALFVLALVLPFPKDSSQKEDRG